MMMMMKKEKIYFYFFIYRDILSSSPAHFYFIILSIIYLRDAQINEKKKRKTCFVFDPPKKENGFKLRRRRAGATTRALPRRLPGPRQPPRRPTPLDTRALPPSFRVHSARVASVVRFRTARQQGFSAGQQRVACELPSGAQPRALLAGCAHTRRDHRPTRAST